GCEAGIPRAAKAVREGVLCLSGAVPRVQPETQGAGLLGRPLFRTLKDAHARTRCTNSSFGVRRTPRGAESKVPSHRSGSSSVRFGGEDRSRVEARKGVQRRTIGVP